MSALRLVKSIFCTVSLSLLITSSVTVAQETQSKLSLQWLGGPTVLIKFGPLQLLTDAMLGEGEQAYQMGDPNQMFDLAKGPDVIDHKRLTALPYLNINDIDLSILSHTHEDHFDQSAQKLLDRQLPFIVPTGATGQLTAQGFTNIRELDWGQQWQLSENGYSIEITALPASHSTDKDINALLGRGNGYWFTFSHASWEKSLYWTGDSFAVPELLDSLNAFPAPDIMLPHLGRVGTSGPLGQISMGAEEVLDLMAVIKPELTIPIHHSTYQLYLEPIQVLMARQSTVAEKLQLLSSGETYVVN
ncbi:MAG: MBL fold metallo-hydrolase [Pseudomonadales bacterium]|nr:MBL fold metallo-hydrolase [Pseudomonadales bacterium]NRA18335.1 MBL fold metallo-hydrolase [Oceanospirillaceae bacterium]